MDCRECHERFRADKLIEDWCAQNSFDLPKPVDALTQDEMEAFIGGAPASPAPPAASTTSPTSASST